MLALLAGVFGKFVGWLADVLPESPLVSAMGSLGDSFAVPLAWLNTFVPISDIAALVGAWALAIVAVVAIRFIKNFTIGKIVSVFDLS